MSNVVFCFILFWTNKCVWSTPLTVIFFVVRVMLTAAFSHCGLSLVVRAAVIQKRETENMGMGNSLSTSAGKGEQMLLLYAPLGKLLKTHCHATYLSRQLFFQIICGSRGTPVKTVFSILWGEASGGPCWLAHLLAQFLSPQAPIKLGAALLLLPTALAKPWRWATKNPTAAFGGLAGGAVREGAWAPLCWRKAQRWETVGEGPRRMRGELRFIGEEASRGNGVYVMIVMSILCTFFSLSEQHWLEMP